MNHGALTALLAAQLALTALVWGLRAGGGDEPEAFLQFDAQAVDSIAVSGADGAVALRRVDGAWQLDSGLPADGGKIDRVLEKLADAGGGWPVGATAGALERFEVTEDAHQRRVTLRAGEETLADVYLGTSPGYQKTHARHVAGGDAYAIGFSNFEAGIEPSAWLKKSLLQPAGELRSITREGEDEAGGWTLTAGETGWTAADVALDSAKAATFAGRFEGLNVIDATPAPAPDAAKLRFTLADDDGEYQLAFHALEEGGDYAVVSSRVEGAFKVASYVVDELDKPLADIAATADVDSADEASADAAAEAPTAAAPPPAA